MPPSVFSSAQAPSIHPSSDSVNARLLRLRPSGMFSNVNEVVEQVRLARQGGYQFIIDWSRSCYNDPDHPGDPWDYYFEPCFSGLDDATLRRADLPELPTGEVVACTRANIITPRLRDADCDPLLLPRDRHGAHDLITRHLRLKPDVRRVTEAFMHEQFTGPVIGLHLRGPGRMDGGAAALRRAQVLDGGVPYGVYFDAVDRALKNRPEAQVLICSDSSQVIDRVRDSYGDRVITYTATRSAFGEMHVANHPANAGQSFSPYVLGLDVLVEAYLLARCDFFVHGNSNVANFVLCAAPDLPHEYVPA